MPVADWNAIQVVTDPIAVSLHHMTCMQTALNVVPPIATAGLLPKPRPNVGPHAVPIRYSPFTQQVHQDAIALRYYSVPFHVTPNPDYTVQPILKHPCLSFLYRILPRWMQRRPISATTVLYGQINGLCYAQVKDFIKTCRKEGRFPELFLFSHFQRVITDETKPLRAALHASNAQKLSYLICSFLVAPLRSYDCRSGTEIPMTPCFRHDAPGGPQEVPTAASLRPRTGDPYVAHPRACFTRPRPAPY